MGLKLITGRANAGHEVHIQEHLFSGLETARGCVFVVPGFADVRRAREELASRAPIGVDVTTFDEWLESLWMQYGDGRRLVTPSMRRVLVAKAAVAATEILGPVSASPGFAELVARVAGRAAGLSRTVGESAVLIGVEKVLARYDRALAAEDLVEPGEATRSMADQNVISDFAIAWSGFSNFSTAQLNFITALSARNEIAVALVWEEGFAATEALNTTVTELTESTNTHIALQSPAPSGEMERVEEQIFSPHSPVHSSGEVVLSEAAGPEAEATLVARAARRALQDGFTPERVAIVFKDLSRRRPLTEMALKAEGITFITDYQAEFTATPLGGALISLSNVINGYGAREDMLHFLRGPFSDVTAERIDLLDARWRRSREVDTRRMLSDAAQLSQNARRCIRLARRAFKGQLTEKTVNNWQQLGSLLLSVSSEVGERPEGDVRLDIATNSRVVEMALQMATSGIAMNGEAFLRSMVSTPISSGSTERPGAIQVTEAHRIRSRQFDVVIVGGLTAAEFSSEKNEPLAAKLLGEMGLSAGMDARLAERMLFYLVITQARSRLELVRQASDASGNPQRPSVFWEEVCDLYKTPEQAARGELGQLCIAHKLRLSELGQAAPALSGGRRERRCAAANRSLRPPGTERGLLSDPHSLLGEDSEHSVTEIEQYLSCPYRWFYGNVIRPSEVDQSFDARGRGSYAHALLAEFYSSFRDKGHERVTSSNLPEALATLTDTAASIEGNPAWQTRGLREELSASTALAWVKSAIEQDAGILEGYSPIAHEWAFGGGTEHPFSMGGVALRGKVDRVDAGPDGLIVMDYKSGAADIGQAAFLKKRALQAVVYARAAEAGFGAVSVAGLYRSLATGLLSGFWNVDQAATDPAVRPKDEIDAGRWSELVGEVEAEIVRAVQGMRDGLIEPRPVNRSACDYCTANRFCEKAAS